MNELDAGNIPVKRSRNTKLPMAEILSVRRIAGRIGSARCSTCSLECVLMSAGYRGGAFHMAQQYGVSVDGIDLRPICWHRAPVVLNWGGAINFIMATFWNSAAPPYDRIYSAMSFAHPRQSQPLCPAKASLLSVANSSLPTIVVAKAKERQFAAISNSELCTLQRGRVRGIADRGRFCQRARRRSHCPLHRDLRTSNNLQPPHWTKPPSLNCINRAKQNMLLNVGNSVGGVFPAAGWICP